MLLARSIFYKICIALFVYQASCEDYEYGSEDNSEEAESNDQPDYSKYYSVDTSLPLISQLEAENTGFASPSEYKYFFSGTPYGQLKKEDTKETKKAEAFTAFPSFSASPAASRHDPLTRDFFEESQKKQQEQTQNLHAEESEILPGPHYISHQIPVPLKFQDELKSASKKEIESITAKPTEEEVQKHVTEEAEDIDIVQKTEDEINKIRMETLPKYGIKNVDYNTGKSSSTVSQYPTAATLFEQSREAATFKPTREEALATKYLEILATTPVPYVPYKSSSDFGNYAAPNQPVASSVNPKNCRKVQKKDEKDMNCFVCEDLTNNEKFTQCSLVSEPSEPVSYYAGTSKRYSSGELAYPFGYRYKRSPRGEEEENDPYESVRRRSLEMMSKFDEEHEAAESEWKKDFLYKPSGGPSGSTEVSYSEAASANIAKNPENCHKVEKEDGNTCTVCKDPKTGGNFESCAYTAKPKAEKYAYVAEKSYDSDEQASPEVQETKNRSRRSPRGRDYYKGYSDKEKDYYGGYEFPYSYNTESYAESQPEEMKMNPENCKKVERKGMTCTVCTDAKTGGNLEQCSYTSAPKEQKYAYVAEKKYDGDEIPLNGEREDTDESKKVENENSNDKAESRENQSEEADDSKRYEEKSRPTSAEEEDDKSVEETKEAKEEDTSYYYYPYDKENSDKKGAASDSYAYPNYFSDKKDKDIGSEFDAFHYTLFPELNKAESKKDEKQQPYTDENKQDVEDVLAEFAKKDRSNCKKAEKNGMTCFSCVDKNKIQHEECMYIQESKPKASHVAYHEVQRLKDDPEGEKEAESEETKTSTETVTIAAEQSVLKATTVVPAALQEPVVSASKEVTVKPKKAYLRKKKRLIKRQSGDEPVPASSAVDSETIEDSPATAATSDSERLEESDTTPKTPKEFDVQQDEGAFTAETAPVYSETFDTTLPKYMVEKSEFEKEFDVAAGF